MAKHVTLSEIGRRAGVSNVAVGAALGLLSEKSSVRLGKEKAAMIRRVAREMGYQPNLLARAFRKQQTRMIGVLFRVVSNPLSVSFLIDSIHRELLQRDYHAYLSPFQSKFDVLEDNVRDLLAWRVDGLVISHIFQTDDAQGRWKQLEAMLAEAGVPYVLVESDIVTQQQASRVHVDLGLAMQQVTEHLLKLGHRQIGFVGDRRGATPERWGAICKAVGACKGARAEVIPLAIQADAPAIQQLALSAQATAMQVATMKDRPTALICNNDLIAAGVITGLQEMGLSVPEDMSVTGYDDSELAMLSRPKLTTFSPPVGQVAATAVNMLLERIEHPEAAIESKRFEAQLIARASTAAPAKHPGRRKAR